MKKILFALLIFIPLLSIAQGNNPIPLRDTITFERDTILKFRVSNEYVGNLSLDVDSLAGTLDGLMEFVVATDFDNNFPSSTFPDDSKFQRYTATMVDTVDANRPYTWFWDTPISYDYIGVRITLNSITKYHIKYKLRLYQK